MFASNEPVSALSAAATEVAVFEEDAGLEEEEVEDPEDEAWVFPLDFAAAAFFSADLGVEHIAAVSGGYFNIIIHVRPVIGKLVKRLRAVLII